MLHVVMRLLGMHVHLLLLLLLLLELVVMVHHLLDLGTVTQLGGLVESSDVSRVHQSVVLPLVLVLKGRAKVQRD